MPCNILQSLMLVTSLSTDAFAAGISFGTDSIKIPRLSAVLISLICSAMLAFSLYLGNVLEAVISPNLSKILCFILLMSMGVVRLWDNCIKNYIRKNNSLKLKFGSKGLKFMLTIYADVQYADSDNSKRLSACEAASLALALSLDSIAVGIGVSAVGSVFWLTTLLSLIMTYSAIKVGSALGNKISGIIKLSYLSAILLILLAFTKLD